jgi:RHS repeat-associated protein
MPSPTRSRRPRHAARLLAAAMALTLVPRAIGAPGDITQIAAPMLGADPPKAQDIADGDVSVATQTGALNYSYPIRVPPGRADMVPKLSLSYSSQAAIYGGIAAGWSLSIPDVRWDTSKGRLRHFDRLMGQWDDEPYVSSLSGGRELIRVSPDTLPFGELPRYRAKNDSEYISYIKQTQLANDARWIAKTPDGITHKFGDPDFITNTSGSVTNADLLIVRAPLTSSYDEFGNTVEYRYKFDGEELRIENIRYTVNSAVNSGNHFAEVVFTYAASPTCAGFAVGSQTSFATGTKFVDGKSKLTQITARAIDPNAALVDHTRVITLGYSADTELCTKDHAPFRQLASIQESAWHTAANRVDLPPVTFEYGAPELDLSETINHNLWLAGPSTLNLGWGHRYRGNQWPSVEAMMLDFDGDGLVDRLINGSSGTECRADVLRNQGDGNFSLYASIQLPRLPWKDGVAPDEEEGEGCFLNYQRSMIRNQNPECEPTPAGAYVAYRWIDMTGDGRPELVTAISHDIYFDPALVQSPHGVPWPTVSGDFSACPGLVYSCMVGARDCDEGRACEIDPTVVNSCIASAPSYACGDMTTSRLGGPSVPDPTNPGPPCSTSQRNSAKPFQLSNKLYPWTYYEVEGTALGSPSIVQQPNGLESDAGDSSISAGGWFGQRQGIFDLDGDGFPDSVNHGRYGLWNQTDEPPSGVEPYWWWVFIGDGHGSFLKDPTTGRFKPFFFQVPDAYYISTSQYSEDIDLDPVSVDINLIQQMVDINGDGTSDYLNSRDVPQVGMHANDGLQIRALGSAALTPDYVMPSVPAASASITHLENLLYEDVGGPGPNFITTATRTAKARLIDLDQDGRPDLFRTDGFGGGASVQLNAGGDLLSTRQADGEVAAGAIQVMTTDGPPPYTWEAKSDLIDLDGDSVPEKVDFTKVPYHVGADVGGTPRRLLTKVMNGRGLSTEVRYAPMSDRTVVKNSHRTSPRTQWVVKSLETDDAFEASSGTVAYEYDDPVFGPDPEDDDRYAFRGFEQVTTTNSRGGKTIQHYGFGVDWSGRVERTVVQTADGKTTSIENQTWREYSLFGGKVKTFHPEVSTKLFCAANQTEAQCDVPATPRLVTAETYTAVSDGTDNVLWAQTYVHVQDGPTFDNGDRYTRTTYTLYTTGGAYRLRDTQTDSFQRASGTDVLFAQDTTTWDPTYRVPTMLSQRLDAAGTLARTGQTFDMSTGNLMSRTTPVQTEVGQLATTNTYDGRRLFVVSTTNELGHVHGSTFEYGTGATVAERGPNQAPCAATSCPLDSAGQPRPTFEGSRTSVDGLGRTIAVETVAADPAVAGAYRYYVVETLAYVDTPSGATPTSFIDRKRIEFTDDVHFTQVKTELDGHGRPIRSTEEVDDTAPHDAVTSYDYDSDGTLVTVTVPDPSQNTAATVTFTYTYDTLGRPLTMRRPDSTTPAQQSGVSFAYNGLLKYRTEIAGAAGGQEAHTVLENDVFGRLVRVKERTALSPPMFADTLYSYSPRDEVSTIIDPTGLVTALEHDFAGRRTRIVRGTRQWKYGYDRNGNMTSEVSPPPSSSPTDIAAHTTSFIYDALDRLTSKLIAPRNTTATDRDLFGTREVTQIWDTAGSGNRIGRLAGYRTFGQSATAVLAGTLSYDAEGNTTQHDRSWIVPVTGGDVKLAARGESYEYAPFGKQRLVKAGDATSSESRTQITTVFDHRGNSRELTIPMGSTTLTFGTQTRNVAGLVTKRSSTQAHTIDSNWTYDELGRVKQQRIVRGTAQLARQDLTYFGTDSPKSLDTYLNAIDHKKLDFTYDHRHQILSASVAGGAFSQTNSFNAAGRFTSANVAVSSPPSSSEVRPRNVQYIYAANDAEAVSELRLVSSGLPYATYLYDLAGNQTRRTYTTPSTQIWDFMYDGEDQLRRVTGSTGTASTIEEYWYDAFGDRALVRTRPTSGPVSWRWFHDNTEVEWQTDNLSDATPTLTQTYAYVSMGTPVARITNRDDSTELQFHGLASSTLATVDTSSGTINTAFLYAPFGEVLETRGPQTASHRRRMNDKYQDVASGLGYYGVRYYDNVAMQWTQSDPLYRFVPDRAWDAPRAGSLYMFVLQNPLSYMDPDGRQAMGTGSWGREHATENRENLGNDWYAEKWRSTASMPEELEQFARVVISFLPGGNLVLTAIDIAVAIDEALSDDGDGGDDSLEALASKGPVIIKPGGGGRSTGGPPREKTPDVVTANGQRAFPDGTRAGPSGERTVNNVDLPTKKSAKDAARASGGTTGTVTHDAAKKRKRDGRVMPAHYHGWRRTGKKIREHFRRRGDKPSPKKKPDDPAKPDNPDKPDKPKPE